MLMYVLALVVLSYLMFVFISNLFNPFIATRAPLRRRRWRLGRAAALSSLVSGAVVLSVSAFTVADQTAVLSLYLIMASIMMLPAIIKYKKSRTWQ